MSVSGRKDFIESQGFCAMAGLEPTQAEPHRAMQGREKHLATDFGIKLESNPAFNPLYADI